MRNRTTYVYLLHFNAPLGDTTKKHGTARHYIGFAKDLPARLQAHRLGNGSAIMRAVALRNIGWTCVRVWEGGDRALERRLKAHKQASDYCPVCRGEVVDLQVKQSSKRRPLAERPISFYAR